MTRRVSLSRIAALKLLRGYWRVARPVTLGVKAILLDENGGVALVRHTYQPGWHLPGGGVKRGEQLIEAAEREVREELGLELLDRPAQAFGIYTNFQEYKSDHVAVYLFRRWKEIPAARPSPEIAEWRFFPVDRLPADATPATQRRLAELSGAAPHSFAW